MRGGARAAGGQPLLGLTVSLGEAAYTVELDPAARTVKVVRPGESFGYGAGRDLLTAVDLEDGADIDLIVREDVLDLTVNGRALTMRMDHRAEAGAAPALWALAGSAAFSAIRHEAFEEDARPE